MTTKEPVLPEWKRPIRIPENITLTHCDPSYALVDERVELRIPFTLSRNVAPGARLGIQLSSHRNNKGEFPEAQIDDPAGAGYISAVLADNVPVNLEKTKDNATFLLHAPDSGLKTGDTLTVTLGDRSGGGNGIKIRTEYLHNNFFLLYEIPEIASWTVPLQLSEPGQQLIVAACTMHIVGGKTERIRAYVPASTRPRESFPVLVRPEDKFGNLSPYSLSDISVSLDGKPIDTSLEPVEDSTCVRAIVTMNDSGVYRLEVTANGSLPATANPTICSTDAEPVYWGMIHGHTELSDGTGKIDDYFNQLKNEVLLDFGAPGDHDHRHETPDSYWAETVNAAKRWNESGRFVAIPGYEWAKWRKNGDGDRNVYYVADDRPMYRSEDGEYASPPDLFRVLEENNEKAIVIPHHTGHKGNFCDWKDHSPRFERLVEIHQNRGSYECSEEDGNPAPETGYKGPYEAGFVRNALEMGWRVGFTGGGDDHSGHWGTEFLFGDYKQGLMSVRATMLNRESIFDAMYNRRVTATTGPRILLAYELNGKPMGSEHAVADLPDLAGSRTLSVEFHGTAPLDAIDIIRNNRTVHSHRSNGLLDVSFDWTDSEPLEGLHMPPAKYCEHPFTYYYVRAVQTDGEAAWASPVWIDS